VQKHVVVDGGGGGGGGCGRAGRQCVSGDALQCTNPAARGHLSDPAFQSATVCADRPALTLKTASIAPTLAVAIQQQNV